MPASWSHNLRHVEEPFSFSNKIICIATWKQSCLSDLQLFPKWSNIPRCILLLRNYFVIECPHMCNNTNVCLVFVVEAVTAICEVSQRIQNNTQCHENHLQLRRVQKLLKGRKTKVLAAGLSLWSHFPFISSKNHPHLLSPSFCIYVLWDTLGWRGRQN